MTLRAAVDEIRTSDAVAVIGAGASYQAGMPLAGQLSPLVWHALDAHPAVMRATCDALGIAPGRPKEVIADDWSRIRAAFAQIAADLGARRTFQASFVQLDRERSSAPSPSHTALARLVHCGKIQHVVSLNWDTLLEAAYRALYGIDINAQGPRLWKPHGDCHRPEESWTLPHEAGSIPDELADQMTALATVRPRTLLIVGYSERDDVVVERLIRPLKDRWRVFRISPAAAGEGAIPLPSPEALAFLAEALCHGLELTGWRYVTFQDQRGIEAAVSGESLGPRDTDVCPRLPHFDSALRFLELLHTVEIAGPAGCGKSITAWQLARVHHLHGREVLRADLAQAPAALMEIPALRNSPWKKLLVIDDAQTFPAGFAEQLAEVAGPKTKVIRAATDTEGERSTAIRIPAQAAVGILAIDFRRRRDEILPIVRRYDPQVGDGYLDVPLERRIEEAEASDTPWQFAFAVRGGWRQAREELNVLRDFDRADLLLIALAARQLLNLDAGCALAELVQDSHLLGRTEEWCTNAIESLRRRAAILHGERLRCLHIRYAAIAIGNYFANRKDAAFNTVVAFLRTLVVAQEQPLRGISWLLHELFFSDAFAATGGTKWAFLLPDHTQVLITRCLSATDAIERRDALHVVDALIDHRAISPEALIPSFDVLTRWLATANGATAYAIGNLINSLLNRDKALARQLVESVEPRSIADLLAEAQCPECYGWGHLLGRLWCAAGPEWRNALRAALPRECMLSVAASVSPAEIGHLTGLLKGLDAYDSDLATNCLRQALPAIQQAFREDPLEALADIREMRWCLLGHDLFERTKPTRAQKKLSKTITAALRPDTVANGLLTCRHGDWEAYAELLIWVRQVNPAKHSEIIQTIDWKRLDDRVTGMWQKPPRDFRLLVYSLMTDDEGRPVRQWVAQHADQLTEIDPILAEVSPEAAVAVVRRGGRLNLAGHNQNDWELQAQALTRVAEIARDVAVSTINLDLPRIAQHLSKLQPHECEGFPPYLRVLHVLNPELLVKLFQHIDLKTAAENWPKRLQEDRKEIRRHARKVFRLARDHGPHDISALAERLLRRR